jgi:hypothetical protein
MNVNLLSITMVFLVTYAYPMKQPLDNLYWPSMQQYVNHKILQLINVKLTVTPSMNNG